jgi:hypothetical protein
MASTALKTSQAYAPTAPAKLARRRFLGGAGVLLGASGCGFILFPERRGRTGGNIDVPILIVDLLWLLPGIIPGVICLIVDFASGCIYGGGAHASTSSTPSARQSTTATVQVELDGEVVATGQVEPDRRARLEWTRAVDAETLRARAQVRVSAADGATAQVDVGRLL